MFCCFPGFQKRKRTDNRAPKKELIKSLAPFKKGDLIICNEGNVYDDYEIETAHIGEGSYGTVRKCWNKKTGNIYAIKTITKNKLKDFEKFQEEIKIMKTLDHPNIVRLYETYEDSQSVYLIMELCNGGELFDKIIGLGKFTEENAATIMRQMFKAVKYMHESGVMHRDLKPENFLFQSAEEDNITSLKLIDFGLSTTFDSDGVPQTMRAGTPYYVSPQVLAGSYTESCDLWSCGVIMFILLCGYPPFHGETDSEVLSKVRLGNYSFSAQHWANVSNDAKDLVRRLLKMNPNERITAKEAICHTWFEMAPSEALTSLTPTLFKNLKNFRNLNKLKKRALHVIAQHMPEKKIQNLKDIFITFDKDGDGHITPVELVKGLRKSGLAIPADLENIMEHVDADNSGVIDYTEFLAATIDHKDCMTRDQLWTVFRTFDADHNGQISRKELVQLLKTGNTSVDIHDIDGILAEADLDGDGQISFEEFISLMKKC